MELNCDNGEYISGNASSPKAVFLSGKILCYKLAIGYSRFSTEGKRKLRGDIQPPPIQEGANAWEKKEVYQLQLVRK